LQLSALLQNISALNIADAEISAVTCDSRHVGPGALFFCVKGERSDGHAHAADALGRGAAAIVAEREIEGIPQDRRILVESTRLAYALCCGNFFGNPAKKLKLIGVTGTNGKTTVTHVIKQILAGAGKNTGLIGTINNEIGDMSLPAKYTTPDPVQLHAMLARMAEAGCEYVVMEVSSHALSQDRVAGLRFACSAFTNLTQDHLDYHHDMESYFEAKKRLFAMSDSAVINLDDPYGERLAAELAGDVRTYSCSRDDADFTAREIRFSAKGSRFAMLHGATLSRVSFGMPGRFSVANALCAAACCAALGIPAVEAAASLAKCPGVPGRVEILETDTPFTIIRDYAHSPDSLLKVLETVREFAPKRVVTLFGCAGNRDRTKRPLMAANAAKHSDYLILTSDNPRDEPPGRIIEDALPGLANSGKPYRTIEDRYEAIEWALDFCEPDDVLVLAGKGHEDYQVLDYGTIFFDEKVIVEELLQKRKA
jgi:UDP-N-acetylmuramoyl-L-alanyl-D-glutamate--2,6-diaminopimelate ligase